MEFNNRYSKLTPELISQLKDIVGENNFLADRGKEDYSKDEAPHSHATSPEVVIKPENSAVISKVLQLASRNKIPVTPRGAGTGLSGGAVPIYGGISLSMEKLKRIIEIDEANFCVTAQAGVTLEDLCTEVEKRNLYLPLYPGEKSATIGGNVSTNAGGMRAVRYGVTRNFILGLEAVLPTGEIIKTGGKYIKSSTAYDLTQLLTGSEGTLAVITEVTLKLIPPPGSREILLVPFNNLSEAIRCVPVILKEKVLPVGIEFMERDIIRLVEDYTGKEVPMHGYPAYLMIMIESDNEEAFSLMAEQLGKICLDNGAVDVFVASSEMDKTRLLEAREKFYTVLQHRGMLDIADVVVPRSQIATFVETVKQIGDRYGIPVIAYGHAGDGNVHLHPMKRDDAKDTRVKDLLKEIYQAGLALGGTISGEHGLGSEKKDYFISTVAREKLELMKRIKLAFDPQNILNPGKVIE
jgi:glycolate oxidase